MLTQIHQDNIKLNSPTVDSSFIPANTIATLRITIKKNNVFMNITPNATGNTLLKFSSGFVLKTKNKKKLNNVVKFLFSKVSVFVKNNFNYLRISIKGSGIKAFSYLKALKKKKLKILSYENYVPLVHNGCRPPKKRRL